MADISAEKCLNSKNTNKKTKKIPDSFKLQKDECDDVSCVEIRAEDIPLSFCLLNKRNK